MFFKGFMCIIVYISGYYIIIIGKDVDWFIGCLGMWRVCVDCICNLCFIILFMVDVWRRVLRVYK